MPAAAHPLAGVEFNTPSLNALKESLPILSIEEERDEEEASVMWLVLHPNKWNKDSHLAWRWHPAELQKVQEQDARKRART